MKKGLALLFLILILGSALRLYRLNEVPVELFGDELDVGYNAYSLLKTGRDYTGHFLPTYISSFAEARAPLYLYSTIPFVALFGLNEWGVRLPAALFGILNLILIFLLVKKLFDNQSLGLISAFLMAITPWHIQFSRAAYEVTLLLCLILFAIYLFIVSFKKTVILPLCAFVLALTPYVYSTANLFLPILLLIFFIVYKAQIIKIPAKYFFVSLAVGFVTLLPLFYNLSIGKAGTRFSQISIFDQKSIAYEIINKRNAENNSGRFFHNKVIGIGREFTSNYLKSFSPQFLFLAGDINLRHSVGYGGEFYLIYLPFMILGLVYLFKKHSPEKAAFILLLTVLAPIPAALTQGGGEHATRLFVLLPWFLIITALGIYYFFDFLKKKKLVFFKPVFCGFVFILFFEFIFYLHQYYVHWPLESWRFWHYGYKETMQALSKDEDNYGQIIFNNTHEPMLIRFLFWTKVDPAWFQKNFRGERETVNLLPGATGFNFDKYYFVRYNGDAKKDFANRVAKGNALFFAFQEDEIPGDWNWQKNPPEGIKVLHLTKNLLGSPYIYLLSPIQ